MGFIGRNGAGKTTTIKLIMGLIGKDKGPVERLDSRGRGMCVGIRETRTGFEALTASVKDLTDVVGEDMVVEKATIEDIMVYRVKGAGNDK